ncbi:polysaccharide biosynthesis C-terminal domain-containing protein [Pseudoflavonifractor capillosus]|uniref:oligosaccharide flippase family protein n=1 Tax=Pseudoflavonifractor capillosus TaxID=106588 RepID=UPI00195E3BA0|nr:polysaccharide biosynthesis C-terminal domain-containing protein [Pseudoflavonifractor capillosus]MBM6896627.1 polysaccharide biosynthesis C-terminal domain-containing protein [Pseudoflavonifractor capillosus]
MWSGTLVLTATGLFAQLVGFFYRMMLSRLIGAETMGLYQLVMPVYSMFMSVTAVGLTVAVSTRSARCHALGDEEGVGRVLRLGLRSFLALAIPLGVVVVWCSDPISVYLLGDARTRLGIVLLVPCMLLTGVENLHKHCFYGTGRVRIPATVETMEQLIRTGAVLGLLILLLPQNKERTVGLVVLGMVICEVFSAVTLVLLFRRAQGRVVPRAGGEKKPEKGLWAIAIPVGLTSVLGTLLGSANAVLIPAKLVEGGMEAGQAMSAFGVLCGMTMPLLSLPTGFIGALCLTMVPALSQRTAHGDVGASAGLLNRIMSVTMLLMAPAMALLTVMGPTLGRLLFGQPQVGQYMLLLAVGTLLTCVQSVLGGALNGLGLQGKGARNAIASDVVQLAFTYGTVAVWGLRGFVVGFVLSSLVGMGLNLASVLHATGLHLRLFAWFVRPVLAAVGMGMWCNLLFHWMMGQGVWISNACLVCVVVGGLMYVVMLMGMGLSVFGWLWGRREKT